MLSKYGTKPPADYQRRILTTRLWAETGMHPDEVERLPLWRIGDYIGYKRAIEMMEQDANDVHAR